MHRIKSPFKILSLLTLFTLAVFFMNSCGGVGGGGSGGGCEDSGSCLSIESLSPVTTADVDAYQDGCCSGDATLTDCTTEVYYRHDATVTITNSDLPGATDTSTNVTITKHTITYTPQTPGAPSLTGQTYYTSFVVPADGDATMQVEMVPIAVKDEFVAKGGLALIYPVSYSVKYKFTGRDVYGNTVWCEGSVSVRMGDFITCTGDFYTADCGMCSWIDLALLPASATITDPAVSDTYDFTIVGGTPPYSVMSSNESLVTVSLTGTTVTATVADVPCADTTVTITVLDSDGNTDTATLTLDVTGLSVSPDSATICENDNTCAEGTETATFTISGGTPPYYTTSSNLPVIVDPGVANPFTVDAIDGSIGGDTTVTLTITDAAGCSTTATVDVINQ
jgi:hypothetical protein